MHRGSELTESGHSANTSCTESLCPPRRDGLCRAPRWGQRHWPPCCLPHSDGTFPDLQRLQSPGLPPLALSAEPTVISAEMRPYSSPSACHPCLQIQPGTSTRPDQIFIPQCCLGGQMEPQKALCSIQLWKSRGVCGKAGPQQHCLSEEGSGWGSRGRKAPTAGL